MGHVIREGKSGFEDPARPRPGSRRARRARATNDHVQMQPAPPKINILLQGKH